jgi:site-specific recombinase XerD
MKGGLIAKLDEVARVAMPGRRPLCKNTVQTYAVWLRNFWRWTGGKPGGQWAVVDIEQYCLHLQRERYAPKSRRQALCALVYVFKNVLKVEIGRLNLPVMAKENKTIKIIPSREELGRIFAGLKGQHRLMAGLIQAHRHELHEKGVV